MTTRAALEDLLSDTPFPTLEHDEYASGHLGWRVAALIKLSTMTAAEVRQLPDLGDFTDNERT